MSGYIQFLEWYKRCMLRDTMHDSGGYSWRCLDANHTAITYEMMALQILHYYLQSLEWYKGLMLRDTMHGCGDYRWRYLGPNHTAVTYEGRFYNNRMHGYGTMSYPDGRVFNVSIFCTLYFFLLSTYFAMHKKSMYK